MVFWIKILYLHYRHAFLIIAIFTKKKFLILKTRFSVMSFPQVKGSLMQEAQLLSAILPSW